jgi:hypothetical protein
VSKVALIAKMGTFAEKANFEYRLSFADQRKQRFRFPFAETKRKFAISFSVCSKQMEVVVFC